MSAPEKVGRGWSKGETPCNALALISPWSERRLAVGDSQRLNASQDQRWDLIGPPCAVEVDK
jgi:hypothetical protein